MDKPVVLLVDDEPRILSALTRSLRREGYQLLTASCGEDALEVLGREQIALIISDYRMPGMNGDELLAKVRDSYPQIRRMMLTGYSSLDKAKDIAGLGVAERLIMKPWNLDELRSAISELLADEP